MIYKRKVAPAKLTVATLYIKRLRDNKTNQTCSCQINCFYLISYYFVSRFRLVFYSLQIYKLNFNMKSYNNYFYNFLKIYLLLFDFLNCDYLLKNYH